VKWYELSHQWHTDNDLAFSYNYYYKNLMVANTKAIKLIRQLSRPYAAMSPKEFFAELYAEFYDKPTEMGIQSQLPAEVGQWLSENIGIPGAETE
jgi:Mlc titration factor MtfA (ptsG expression regulator)